MNVLDLLLKTETSVFNLPKEEIKIKRLSKLLNEDIIFEVSAVSLDRLEELRESTSGKENFHSLVVIEGVKSPNLKSKDLQDKFGTHTSIETIKKMLLAGEIEDLYLKIAQLSGYGAQTYEEIKKN